MMTNGFGGRAAETRQTWQDTNEIYLGRKGPTDESRRM
jgi:hypothetical protein